MPSHEQGPARGVQRRRDRDPHHDHGPRAPDPLGADPRRPPPACPRLPELRPQLHQPRDLLGQPPSPDPRREGRRRPGPVGQPAPAVLALAGPVHDRLDGREPSRAGADRPLRGGAAHGGRRVAHPPGDDHPAPGSRLAARRRVGRRRPGGDLRGVLPRGGRPRGRPAVGFRRAVRAGGARLACGRPAGREPRGLRPRAASAATFQASGLS